MNRQCMIGHCYVPCNKSGRLPLGRKAIGTTLAEVLVTVVILNIGILTAARLLNESLQSLGDNRYQQRAVRLGADLAELLSHTSVVYAAHVNSPANHGCERNICNPQQFVEHSLQTWQARATQLLPDGRGSVELQTAGDQTIVHIMLLWTPSGAQSVRHHTQATLLPDA